MSNEQPKQPPVTVVSASAGSGKTRALTEVYLEKLLKSGDPHPFREILAITFTNAAALEMKERIITRLKEEALQQGSLQNQESVQNQGSSSNKTPLGSPHNQQKAAVLLNDLFRHYHYFSVQTIDSFIRKIIAGSALSLGLPAKFEIADRFEDHLAYSYDEVIANSNTNPRIRKTGGRSQGKSDVDCYFFAILSRFMPCFSNSFS